MSLPVFALIGRPNVGKSTLFNALTRSRNAIVADIPGVTRDRQYGIGRITPESREFLVVDTGGIAIADKDVLHTQMATQIQQAIEDADKILFLVDGYTGLTAADLEIAERLRRYHQKVILVVNKLDKQSIAPGGEFFSLGFKALYEVSAVHRTGLESMLNSLLQEFPEAENIPEIAKESIAVAVVGHPNVGKSTLINRILGEDRVLVMDKPGTTRDSIYIPFERRGQQYTLIDTAGIRKRSRMEDAIEKFSAAKTMQAIEQAEVVLLIMDARVGITEQDMRLLGLTVELGKALVVVMNKWDGLSEEERNRIKDEIDRRLQFVSFARRYWISALHGSGVGQLFSAIHEAHDSATKEIPTSELTRILEKAVEEYQPPLVERGYRVRMRYAHLGGHNPMVIVIHGKRLDALPSSYQRYLASYFRKALDLVGVPLQLRFKKDANPYADPA
jgi:GTP-binding protein